MTLPSRYHYAMPLLILIDGELEHHMNNITLYRSEVEHLISGIFDLLYFVHLTFQIIFSSSICIKIRCRCTILKCKRIRQSILN